MLISPHGSTIWWGLMLIAAPPIALFQTEIAFTRIAGRYALRALL